MGQLRVEWGLTPAAPHPQVQCFDPKEDQWSIRSPAPFSQRCLEAVSLEDTIYIVGGLMSKIFTYCPGTDVWGEAALLPSPVVSEDPRQFPNRSNII